MAVRGADTLLAVTVVLLAVDGCGGGSSTLRGAPVHQQHSATSAASTTTDAPSPDPASSASTASRVTPSGALPPGPAESRIIYGAARPTDLARRVVYDAYAQLIDLLQRLVLNPRAEAHALQTLTAGTMRTDLDALAHREVSTGTIAVGPVTIRPVVSALSGDTAVVTDCVDASRQYGYRRGRRTTDHGEIGVDHVRLERVGGRWIGVKLDIDPPSNCH